MTGPQLVLAKAFSPIFCSNKSDFLSSLCGGIERRRDNQACAGRRNPIGQPYWMAKD